MPDTGWKPVVRSKLRVLRMPAAGSAFGGCRCIGEVFEEVFFVRAAEVLEGEDVVGVELFPGLGFEVHTAFFKCVPPY